jgi:hypothetical protein
MKKKFKITSKMWNKLCELNEKYYVMPCDLENDDLMAQCGFFDIIYQMGIESRDRLFVEYAFGMVDLCQCYYYDEEQIEEFKIKARELLLKYEMDLLKLEEIENDN